MYVHCHSCCWEQDDFWSKSYNPFTVFWMELKLYARPQFFVEHERNSSKPSRTKYHSWECLICQSIPKFVKKWFTQTWWTVGSWRKTKMLYDGYPPCPKCDTYNLDVD